MLSITNRLLARAGKRVTPRVRVTAKKTSAIQALGTLDKARVARLLRSPWLARGKGSFCTRPATLYAQKMFQCSKKKCGKSRNPLAVLHAHAQRYEALNASQKRPYEALAAKNRKIRVADRKQVRGFRASPYALFMKKHYASVSEKYKHVADPSKRLRLTSRAVAAKWKATSRAQREGLRALASRQRVAASRKLLTLVHKMKTTKA